MHLKGGCRACGGNINSRRFAIAVSFISQTFKLNSDIFSRFVFSRIYRRVAVQRVRIARALLNKSDFG
ncbi:hypothetical protein WGR15_05710 [Enterobacter asburiae]|uniref:hypothetical protein n=1 Tax=Enterobacter asburiae TaxID=61645 RepID=UPI0037C08E1F